MRCCAISSSTTHMLKVSSPPPPYSSGAPSAHSPEALVLAASRAQSSSGSPGASGSSVCSSGMISSRTKRRTCSRSTRSSSGSVNPENIVMGRDDTIAAMSDEILTAIADGVATVTMNRPDQRNAMNTAMLTGLRAAFDDLESRRDVRVVLVRGAGPAFCAGMDLKEMESRAGARDPEGDVMGVVQRVAPAAGVEAAALALARTVADNAPLSLAGMKAVIQRAVANRPAVDHADLDAAALSARKSADASEGRRAMLEKRKPNFRGE